MKDPRYAVVKQKIEAGEITMFSQIFDVIPVEEFATDLWLQQHPEYSQVPDTPEALQEISAWVTKLLNPMPSPAAYFAFQSEEVKGN